jgi:thioredoxin 1
MNNVIELNEANFELEVLRAPQPVLVDFYAPWCGPCRRLAPLLGELARDFDGRIKVVKVNVDEAPGLAADYAVTGVPTLMIFRGGQAIEVLVGLASPRHLLAKLEAALQNPAPPALTPAR